MSRIRRLSKARSETILVTKDMAIFSKRYDQLKHVSGEVLTHSLFQYLSPPKGMPTSDFLIVSALDFLERTEKLFQCCSLFCTSETCPMFNAGPHYHYFWEDESTTDPVQVSAPEYLMRLIFWSKRKLGNTQLFPKETGKELSEDALTVIQTIFRRTLRIYNHLYLCHFKMLHTNGIEPVINTLLAHYALFALKYQLIEVPDIAVLKPVFQTMKIPIPDV
ncbi:Mob1/phocein family protein [Trichomonas vaginalis G3]|uniref:Mob1/phocein family protein n=1 Tax=Trichomonas vaginalis (strain ATCC PRA-98 / G3) TaxID=412133 RepID=A2DT84_TRIV3|nr:hippo signaling [Trichomonas vaginalis G3]EAY16356.1 Mob1/phocein family protein [Trichomonas vaginalis G3]KAI5488414.1 hippo signaling [Trichomonas vaginalis G3]|eukprot:XP_001328579.1 Mob1/phocein family protein [Trichomonas vaginalis G3]